MNTCGGYLLTSDVDRPAYVSADLLPPRLLSISDCICDFVPDLWAVEWAKVSAEDRAAEAAKHGIGASELLDLITWTTQHVNSGSLGWPCVFFSVGDARAFASRFLPIAPGRRLLGVSLHASYVERFLAEERPGPSAGTPGIYKAVSDRAGLEGGSIDLGWEVLCYDHGGFHSWLCNGLETEIANTLGIRPNDKGFIAAAEDAHAAASFCGRDEVGAEPGFWAPWLVVEYGLHEAMRRDV